MTDDRDNTASAEDTGAGSLGSLIKRTAVMTVLCFLVVVSLVASLIGCFFPKAYMELYRSVGAYGISSVYAEEALDRASHNDDCTDTDCDYIMLVTAGVDVTSIAFDDKASDAHAARLLKFTDAYLSASCHVKHSAATDAYYASVYKDKKDVATLAAVYGYDGYVSGRRTAALGVLASGEKEYADMLSETVADAASTVTEPDVSDVNGDVYAAFDVLTACAQYSAITLDAYSETLKGAFDYWRATLDALEDVVFGVVRLRYKLYRFASAMSKSGSATITGKWTAELVSQTFDDYNKTITKYTTQAV